MFPLRSCIPTRSFPASEDLVDNIINENLDGSSLFIRNIDYRFREAYLPKLIDQINKNQNITQIHLNFSELATSGEYESGKIDLGDLKIVLFFLIRNANLERLTLSSSDNTSIKCNHSDIIEFCQFIAQANRKLKKLDLSILDINKNQIQVLYQACKSRKLNRPTMTFTLNNRPFILDEALMKDKRLFNQKVEIAFDEASNIKLKI